MLMSIPLKVLKLLQEWVREEEALLKAKHAVMASSSLQMPAVSGRLLAATAPESGSGGAGCGLSDKPCISLGLSQPCLPL